MGFTDAMKTVFIVIVSLINLSIVLCEVLYRDDGSKDKSDVFVPTKEWQEVKKGIHFLIN